MLDLENFSGSVWISLLRVGATTSWLHNDSFHVLSICTGSCCCMIQYRAREQCRTQHKAREWGRHHHRTKEQPKVMSIETENSTDSALTCSLLGPVTQGTVR